MAVATTSQAVQPIAMQGIAIPAAIVDKNEFLRRTRRHVQQEKKLSFTLGTSTTDIITLRRSDILGEINLHIVGNLTITPGTGSVASTAAWPYGLIKNVAFQANGVSSLISARGWTLKAREMAKDEGLSDRGVSQTIGGTPRTQGTLSLAQEAWGVGQNTTGLAAATNVPVDFVLSIPVAEDLFDLNGAIFLQTSSAELSVAIQWAQTADLFALTGNGAVTFTGTVAAITKKFEIPTQNGAIIVPDLSMFHSFVETSDVAVGTGVPTETIVAGQGAGKLTLRIIAQLMNGAGNASAPVPLNATNFSGLMGWRYGTAETPDQWPDGAALRYEMERQYNADLGGLQGYWVHEFAKASFRDVVDQSVTSDLRLVTTIDNSVTLDQAKLFYAIESMYRSGQAA